jgi:hypothetical protein
MRWYEAAGIGIVMGALCCLTLWASVDALSLVSFMNYGDRFYMPLRVTAVVMCCAFLCLFSVPIWYPYAEDAVQRLGEQIAEDLKEQDDDEDE